MNHNAEFIKSFKLEFSIPRFVVSVLLFFGILYAGTINTPIFPGPDDNARASGTALFNIMCTLGFFFAILWPGRLILDNLQKETGSNSWIFICTSPMSAWRILWGKALGCTALVWIITASLILPTLLYGVWLMRQDVGLIFTFGLSVILWMILAIANIFIFYFLSDTKSVTQTKRETTALSLMTLLVNLTIGGFLVGLIYRTPFYLPLKTLSWYGIDLPRDQYLLMVIAFATFWSIIAAYRVLRQKLYFHDAPWAWLLFMIVCPLFLNGFVQTPHTSTMLFFPIIIALTTSYILPMVEAGNIVKYQKILHSIKKREWNLVFFNTPLWTISFTILILSMASLALINKNHPQIFLTMVCLLGFITRDIIVFHAIHWTHTIRRPTLAIGIYLLSVYIILPLVFSGHREFFFPLFELPIKNGTPTPDMYWLILFAQLSAAGLAAYSAGRKRKHLGTITDFSTS